MPTDLTAHLPHIWIFFPCEINTIMLMSLVCQNLGDMSDCKDEKLPGELQNEYIIVKDPLKLI